jgi:geranylgeranyl diphosphate synthase type I
MTTEFSALLASFRGRLEGELSTWFADRRRDTREYAPEAEVLLDAVASLVEAGGKRLRPALVYFGYLACGGPAQSKVMPLAMATELLHAYLLIHDDIMDHAEVRRGKPSAHAFFRDRHKTEGWPDDAGDYGRAMAILVGDLAHTHAVELFSSVLAGDVPSQTKLALHRIFFPMCREVIDGQYLEMHMGYQQEPSEEDLRRVLRLKSGLYSVERPLQLGATLAQASEGPFQALCRYGAAVGEAFQLQDDLLGMFGDPKAVGKPVGDDLKEGKFTFLMHHALRLANAEQRSILRAAFGRTDLSEAEVEAACWVIRDSGGRAAVVEMIEACSQEARDALDGIELVPAGKAFLLGLIDYLNERQD